MTGRRSRPATAPLGVNMICRKHRLSAAAARWALIAALSAAPGAAPGAADWRVAPQGPPLMQVVAQAANGDRILLGAGIYRVQLRITKPLTLQGEGAAIIDGGGNGDVIRIAAPDVTIRQLDLRDSGHDLTNMNAVIFVEKDARNVRIEDNTLHSTAFGIWVDGSPGAHIADNRIEGDVRLRSQDRGNGIHLFNVTGAVVAGNEVWHTRDGIYIDTSNGNTLRGNHLHDLRYGIHYMYSHHNQVVDNRTDHTRTGYALMQSKYLTVVGNRSDHDENYGILMNYIVYSTLEGNIVRNVRTGTTPGTSAAIEGAEGKAIFIYNSQFNTIRDNVFADSGIGIHLTAGSEDNTVYGNAFVHNRVQVKYVATRSQEWSHDGRGNFWSDYLGWDANADGIGDRPYEPNDGIDRLLWKYPAAKVLMHSPAVETLHWVQSQFPVLRPQGVKDSFPLMAAPPQSKGLS